MPRTSKRKRPKLVRYVDIQEDKTEYQRHRVYGVHDGEVSLQSTQFVSSSSIPHSFPELASGENEPHDFTGLWDELPPGLDDQTTTVELPMESADQTPSFQKSKRKRTAGVCFPHTDVLLLTDMS